MKLTVLVDNNNYVGEYYLGESGASYFIEADGLKILMDTGYSEVFMKNAEKMNIDLGDLDMVVLSHGHNDHTGGLASLLKMVHRKKLMVVAHPEVFTAKRMDGELIGSPVSKEEVARQSRLVLTRTPFRLTDNLIFLGEIPAGLEFETRYTMGVKIEDGREEEDFVLDDSALVYKGVDGIYIISCCSHSGICNIIEYAKRVTGENRVKGVIGGLHLFDGASERVEKTAAYLAECEIDELYPCHCTSFDVKAKIHSATPIKEAGVGLKLDWK